MIRVYGYSDDVVEIEKNGVVEDEIDCYDRDVIITFVDGTVIRIGYVKPNIAVWWINILKHGSTHYMLLECNDENEEIYSDIFEIDSDISSYSIVHRGNE